MQVMQDNQHKALCLASTYIRSLVDFFKDSISLFQKHHRFSFLLSEAMRTGRSIQSWNLCSDIANRLKLTTIPNRIENHICLC